MIRPYKDQDLPDLLEVWYTASLVAHPFLDDAFLAQERQNIAQVYLPAAKTWVFEQNGRVVGFLSLIGHEVGGLFVHAQYHGQGIGRALINHAHSRHDTLELDVFADNVGGHAFYKRMGFVEVGHSRHDATGLKQLRLKRTAPAPDAPRAS